MIQVAAATIGLPDLTGWQKSIPGHISLGEQAPPQQAHLDNRRIYQPSGSLFAFSTCGTSSATGPRPAFSFSQAFTSPQPHVERPVPIRHTSSLFHSPPPISAFDPSGPFGATVRPASSQAGPVVGYKNASQQRQTNHIQERTDGRVTVQQLLEDEHDTSLPAGVSVGPARTYHQAPVLKAALPVHKAESVDESSGTAHRSIIQGLPSSLPARPTERMSDAAYREWRRSQARRSVSPTAPMAESIRPLSLGVDLRFARMILKSQGLSGGLARGNAPSPESRPEERRSAGSSGGQDGQNGVGSTTGGSLASRLEPYSTYLARQGRRQ